jgi:hypothetical protein
MTWIAVLAFLAVAVLVSAFVVGLWAFALDVARTEDPLAGCVALATAAALTLLIMLAPFLENAR